MENSSVVRGLVYGGLASCNAEVVTIPVDVVKTRLQMDGAGKVKAYSGSFNCVSQLVRGEGPSALFKGLSPALLRQSTYGSMRYGLYAPIRGMLGFDPSRPKEFPLWKKIVAGAGSGAIASALANPTDLIKVRLQTDGMLGAGAEGGAAQPKYRRMIDCFRQTVREEGFMGLGKGVGPNMGRATVLAAAELATYDEAKLFIQGHGIITQDGLPLHAATGFVSGFVSTVASSPFDVVKSRVMGQPVDAAGSGTLYRGMTDCFVKSVRQEGLLSLYNGFLPNFGRIVPRVTIVFICMEQLKLKFG